LKIHFRLFIEFFLEGFQSLFIFLVIEDIQVFSSKMDAFHVGFVGIAGHFFDNIIQALKKIFPGHFFEIFIDLVLNDQFDLVVDIRKFHGLVVFLHF